MSVMTTAEQFIVYIDGPDVAADFARAVDEALLANGYGGYSGTIAEKITYRVLEHQPMRYEDAVALAKTIISELDPSAMDSAVPAGAFRVKDPGYDGWLFFGLAAA